MIRERKTLFTTTGRIESRTILEVRQGETAYEVEIFGPNLACDPHWLVRMPAALQALAGAPSRDWTAEAGLTLAAAVQQYVFWLNNLPGAAAAE